MLEREAAEPERVIVSFIADRNKLDQYWIKVVTQTHPSQSGYAIQIKDFIDLSKLR